MTIDTEFDVYSDTPGDRDPDSHSPTLRRYHQRLWSKPLPDGTEFVLSTGYPKAYLHHKSHRGEFFLSSDSIGHTYRYVKAMAPIIDKMPQDELDQFFTIASTVGAYIVFPSQKIDRRPTINGARGMHWKIRDRFDLTLECIRRHYNNEENPLAETLLRYSAFFDLFESFKNYVQFFLLQDLVTPDGASVEFLTPFRSFDDPPLPSSIEDYLVYKERIIAFIMARNRRIAGGRAGS